MLRFFLLTYIYCVFFVSQAASEEAQHVLDDEQASDFDETRALAVFLIHDAGNKKREKLT